ncbi:MAG: hypothetical protein Q7V61_03800 [Actinomycetota bacterium]|nr:hypothetical protein [Actinomycetota bacterium]
MSDRSAETVITSYLAGLRVELTGIGAADADEIVTEIGALLREAADGDADRATLEAAKLGDAAQLAAGIVAERGMDASGGLTTSEWWRLGVAATIDITIGLAVPAAAAVAALVLGGNLQPPVAGVLWAAAILGVSLLWPWYVWRAWRTGSGASAGMTLTGVAVVRAPGFRRIVRSDDLASLGLRSPRRNVVAAVAITALAAALLLAVGTIAAVQAQEASIISAFELSGGDEAAQRSGAQRAVADLYEALIGGHEQVGSFVTGPASAGVLTIKSRTDTGVVRGVDLAEPERLAPGVWTVAVHELEAGDVPAGRLKMTVNRRIVIQPRGAIAGDWVITDITEY